jgi:hypothetical protein
MVYTAKQREHTLMADPALSALKRIIMMLPILKPLVRQLTKSGWLKNTQQTIWAAC